jgi:hypothetical protein
MNPHRENARDLNVELDDLRARVADLETSTRCFVRHPWRYWNLLIVLFAGVFGYLIR